MSRDNAKWTFLFQIPNGHSFFRENATGKVAIADMSGRFPDETDDGVLYVDNAETLQCSDPEVVIPLKTPDGESFVTVTLLGSIFFAMKNDAFRRSVSWKNISIEGVSLNLSKW